MVLAISRDALPQGRRRSRRRDFRHTFCANAPRPPRVLHVSRPLWHRRQRSVARLGHEVGQAFLPVILLEVKRNYREGLVSAGWMTTWRSSPTPALSVRTPLISFNAICTRSE